MPFSAPNYYPSFFFRNGHSNTILPFFFRKKYVLAFQRKTLPTPDGDFLDIDLLQNGRSRCVVLVHGLEGSAQSAYILSLARLLQNNNWDVAALNLRGCSGKPNKLYRTYHSGATDDLSLVIENLRITYSELAIVGFSLGGNIVLKYAGENGANIPNEVKAVVGVSVPCHLSSSSDKLNRWQNYVYSQRFLVSLKDKLKAKMLRFPGIISNEKYSNIKTIRDFDDAYTGPANGYVDAEDYYSHCSSVNVISKVAIPTLLINAQDDPFLTEQCFPYEEAEANSHIQLFAPTYGGHVGFWPDSHSQLPKHEEWILAFLATHFCA